MRNYYSTCIKPPPNPSKNEKSGSEMRKRNQTVDQTNVGKRGNQPAHPRATGKRSSRTTAKYWPVLPRLRSTSTKQIKHPAGAVDVAATTH
jgi:hypothetical protein